MNQLEGLMCELRQAQEECQYWKKSHDQLRSELDESRDKVLDYFVRLHKKKKGKETLASIM